MNRLPDHLKDAAAARTDAAAQRARDGLKKLIDTCQPVSFAAVAREAAVSTDFLYRHPQLRALIERYRTKTTSQPLTQPADAESVSCSTSAAVRALARKIEEMRRTHRAEVAELRKALEAAQGENLELRRQLASHVE